MRRKEKTLWDFIVSTMLVCIGWTIYSSYRLGQLSVNLTGRIEYGISFAMIFLLIAWMNLTGLQLILNLHGIILEKRANSPENVQL